MRPRLRLKQRALRLRMARKNIHVACTRSPSSAPRLNPPSCPCPPLCSTSTSSSACRGPPPPATAKVPPPPTASFFFKTQLQVTVLCTRCIRPGSHQLLRPHCHGLLHHRLHLHRALPPRSPPHPNQTLFLFSHRKLPPPHVSTSPRPSHHPHHRAHAALAEHSPVSPVQCLPSCSGLSECRPPPPLHHPPFCFNPPPLTVSPAAGSCVQRRVHYRQDWGRGSNRRSGCLSNPGVRRCVSF